MSERMLVDTVHRFCRIQVKRVAVVLHLSRLRPPAPRPHHRRVARALLHDTAQRHDGQVFVLRNGDQVLICAATPPGRPASGPRRAPHDHPLATRSNRLDPHDLPEMLARLMQIDAPDPARLTSLFTLPGDQEALVAYAQARLAEIVAPTSAEEEGFGHSAVAATIANSIGLSPGRMRMHRQTGVRVALQTRSGFRPIHTEFDFSPAGTAGSDQSGPSDHVQDPFLRRYLAHALERERLRHLDDHLGQFFQPGGAAVPPIHLNLTLDGLGLAEFGAIAARCHAAGIRLAVEIPFLDACADPERFCQARRTLHRSGLTIALDGLSHLALGLSAPAVLGADLYKLDWSPRLHTLDNHDLHGLRSSLALIGLERIILNGADDEPALMWGLGQGITRFQGRHVDVILAAERMVACRHSAACTLAQCTGRAGATDPAGRHGCTNPSLLDKPPAFVAPQPIRGLSARPRAA